MKRMRMSAHFDHIRGEGEAGTGDSLRSKRSVRGAEPRQGRSNPFQGLPRALSGTQGAASPAATLPLSPAGGANRGANGKEKGAHFVGAPLLAPPAGLEPATT